MPEMLTRIMVGKTQQCSDQLDAFKATAAAAFQKSQVTQCLIGVDMAAW